MSATAPQCPVCNFSPFSDRQPCPRCGWEAGVVLGDETTARDYMEQQLASARAEWQARRYDPDLIPALERDPFETWDEFAERLGARPWYVGQAVLQKDGYDIESGRFPLRIEQSRDWAQNWLEEMDGLYLQLSRDSARALYAKSPTWPAYIWLVAEGNVPSHGELLLVALGAELPVEWVRRIGQERRYLDTFDGTVVDSVTGLQWMRCALGQTWENHNCHGSAGRYIWQDAMQAADKINSQGGFAGFNDWRLPSPKELKSIVLCSSSQPRKWNVTRIPCQGDFAPPTICHDAFPNNPMGIFWSASPLARNSGSAWCLHFNYGGGGYREKYFAAHVRLVRGGLQS